MPVSTGSPSRGGDVAVYVFDINQPGLPTPFSSVLVSCFCLYGLFKCISFHKFSRQLSTSSLCSSGLFKKHFFMAISGLFPSYCWIKKSWKDFVLFFIFLLFFFLFFFFFFSSCSSGLISAFLVLSTIYLFPKVSFSPDVIPSC